MSDLLQNIQTGKTERKESTLTFGIVIVMLLMFSFVCAGVYVLVSTFYS